MNLWSWKPLFIFNGAFLVYVIARSWHRPRELSTEHHSFGWPWGLAVAALTAAVYLPSQGANFVHTDWTHRVNTEHAGALHFFTARLGDGSWRPLGFLSLWIDDRIFGPRLWAYHIQNILLHAANALLAGMVAGSLKVSVWASRFTALLFGLGAIRFEAVVWPGARFDLLATTFSLAALLLFLDYWRTERGLVARGIAVLAAYLLAVASKETGYSLLLVFALLTATARPWGLPPMPRSRAVWLACALAICTAGLIAVRFALYGGIGGYPAQNGRPAQFHVSLRTAYLLVRNALAGSTFLLNSSPHSAWQLAILAAFAVIMLATAFVFRGTDSARLWALIGLTLVSAAPVITLIGWIQPGLEESRYLYWPSLWMCILFALIFDACRGRTALACAFLAVQTAGVSWNVGVYRDMFHKAAAIAEQVRSDAGRRPIAAVEFLNVGASPDGVFPFGVELKTRTQAALPGAAVETCMESCGGATPAEALIYRWNEQARIMTRLR